MPDPATPITVSGADGSFVRIWLSPRAGAVYGGFSSSRWGPLLIVPKNVWPQKEAMQPPWEANGRANAACTGIFRDFPRSSVIGWLALAGLCGTGFGEPADWDLKLPGPDDHKLNILAPNLLELVRVNTKQPDPAPVDSWDWVTGQGVFSPGDTTGVRVVANGQTNAVSGIGFRRRPVYAPLYPWDLRIGNYLYLQLRDPISEGQSVRVVNDGSLWPTNMEFSAVADPLRSNPAIHVNQEGYLPTYPKKAIIGYYLGNLGEMPIPTNRFVVVNTSGAPIFQGTLSLRPDVGYSYSPTPYQSVYEADFSGLNVLGGYRLRVPGMGASLPFRIDEGVAMDFARTYALGIFHQRSGYEVAMPFTRFTHAADHLTPAAVPVDLSPPYAFTWTTISNYTREPNPNNPAQTAPVLAGPSAQLYPFVNPGPIDVSGGHFEAANYSKVTWNSAQVIHILMFAVDSLPGVAALDNLGLPESGDGISDVLQEARWEADFLAKMQDADGGFYYMMYPQFREYEYDVLPENGDPQVLWPKNTASTAAAVAALAQCASSPLMKQVYPQAASNYWARAQLGWRFLTNAIAAHGEDGAYQKIMHFDDDFADRDELAWAACEMFLATGEEQFRMRLEAWFPDPTKMETTLWGWWRMYACYGNAIRDYAMGARSGRLPAGVLNQSYLAACVNAITNCGNDNLAWSQDNAYGTSFPDPTKRVLNAGWYFSTVQAFDMAVAQQFRADPAYFDAILRNLNYEAGCNPVNVCYVTGLGWKRQRQVVDQYSANDRRALPKTGIPVGNIQSGFVWTWTYGGEPTDLCFPADGAPNSPYPFYDRWCDFWNVTTEASTANTVRCLATTAWLAAQTSFATQRWRWTNAIIAYSGASTFLGQPLTVTLQVADSNLTGARIVWEALDQEPVFGGLSYTFTPELHAGDNWVEAEVQWPDGRRAFATNAVTVTDAITNGPPQLADPRWSAHGGFSFLLAGVPQATYVIQSSIDLGAWGPVTTNTLPASGVSRINDAAAGSSTRRYYRAARSL
jgi:hypothetical protein